MSARRNPVYVFKDRNSVGIYDVPLDSMVQIVDSDGAGNPLLTLLIDKTNLVDASIIGDYLNGSGYSNLDKDTTYTVGATNTITIDTANAIDIDAVVTDAIDANTALTATNAADIIANAVDINTKAGVDTDNIFTGENTLEGITVLGDTGIVVTSDSNNILDITPDWDGTPVYPLGNHLRIGANGDYASIDSIIWEPIVLKNDTAIQAVSNPDGLSPAGAVVNLISRTATDTNTGTPAAYDNEVIVGDGGVVTAIRATTGADPVVRKGNYGSTDDHKILTREDIQVGAVIDVIADPSTATTIDIATKVNELIDNLKAAGIVG